MKNLTCSILILLAFGCSKKSPDSAPIAPSAPTETRETLAKEILKKAENNYLSTLEIFESSSTEKLKDQEQAYLAFEKEATHYLNLLKLANTSVIEIDKVKDVISSKKARYLEISSLLQKLNDSLSTLEDSKLKLKKFKKDTNRFQLTKITELGLRDLILETISIYNNSSTFLKLT
ncbi:MAG: hypothetical protein KC478_16540, partial [Bacteriovoracaceae bacterium]|nr:hypothetical protein [Bacteriovoracaceae bacterium]